MPHASTFPVDANTLAVNSEPFTTPNCGDAEREGMQILAHVLSISGTHNYHSDMAALLNATRKFTALSDDQRKAISTYRALSGAINSEASVPGFDGSYAVSNMSLLKAAAAKYSALSTENRRNILTFLQAELSSSGYPI